MKKCLVFALLALSSSAYAVDDEIEDVAFEQHLGSADSFEILRNDEGEILSIVGRFDSAGESDHTVAVTNLLSQLGIAAPDLRLREVQPIDNETDVARFDQYLHGLRCLDAEVSVTFSPNGDIRSINGVLHPAAHSTLLPSMTYVDVLERVAETGLEPLTDGAWVEVSKNRWENDFGFSIEYGWSTSQEMALWHYIDDQAKLELADNGSVHDYDISAEQLQGVCNLRVLDYPRDSAGRATGFYEVDANTGPTRVEQATCEASEWFGSCTWQMRREEVSNHQIGRVQDDDGAEQEIVLPCNSSTIPSFTGTGPDALREQGAFYAEAKMRYYMNQKVWGAVGAQKSSNVQITVDDKNTSSMASFWWFTTDIRCNPSFPWQNSVGTVIPTNGCTQESLAHEYGHYVNWTYGDFSSLCNNTDQGNSMEETMATVAGLLYILDDAPTLPRYGSLGGMGGNLPSEHSLYDAVTYDPQLCNADADHTALSNQRLMGHAFTSALWEVLWNRNCAISTCTGNETTIGNYVFPTLTSQDQVLAAVGAAFAYAQAVLGENTTYVQFRSAMDDKIESQYGLTSAIRFRAIFAHHGL